MVVVRVQGANGFKRVAVDSVAATWASLLAQIANAFDIDVGRFRISRRQLHNPEWIVADDQIAIGSLGIEHGTLLYIQPDPDAVVQESSGFKLTPQCQHSVRGRCLHCMPKASADDPIAPWLCTHPPSAFCPKCLPPEEAPEQDDRHDRMGDGAGADSGKPLKFDVIPYRQFLDEKRALCRYKHSASTVCHLCAPPSKIEYVGKARCGGGHRPWPHGVCGKCAPPNAVLKLQSYRYCDGISFKDLAAGERFISQWAANPGLQRAAILFGRYIDEPTETGNTGALRAEVEGVYMPPQEGLPDGVRLLKDPSDASNLKVASELGLEPVGWAITTLPRNSAEYGGEVFLSGREIRQAARFQLKYCDSLVHSRFVSMVIQYNEQGNVEPRAYQISDHGVALERDGIIEEGSKIGFLRPRMPKKGDLLSSVIYKNKVVKPGDDFIPDELLVKVVSMKPHNPQPMFKYVHFPFNGTEAHFAAHLQVHRNEPIQTMFSDFLLLLFLPRVLPETLVTEIVKSVKGGSPPPAPVQTQIDYALKKFL